MADKKIIPVIDQTTNQLKKLKNTDCFSNLTKAKQDELIKLLLEYINNRLI